MMSKTVRWREVQSHLHDAIKDLADAAMMENVGRHDDAARRVTKAAGRLSGIEQRLLDLTR
jgi:hypothetical protein